MAENNINGVMDSTIDKIRSMVDSETIIGDPIAVNDITIIPVSKLSFGFASGGSDFPSKTTGKTMFGGGGGAGATVTPVVFISLMSIVLNELLKNKPARLFTLDQSLPLTSILVSL